MPENTRIRIEVTEQDIERAHRSNSYHCVVAQAVARTVKDARSIDVDIQTIRFTRDGGRWIFLTPYAVQGYIVAFDAGDPIEPFTFELRNPMRGRRRKLTDDGRAAARAYNRALYHAKKEGVETARAGDPETEGPHAVARAAYASAKPVGSPQHTELNPGAPRNAPMMFKLKRRAYGHRVLRINQTKAAAEAIAE